MIAAPTSGEPAMPRQHASVGGVGSALWRRKFWIVIPTLLALLGSMAVVNILRLRYSGEARVLLENRDTVYSRPDRDNRGVDPAIDPEAVASQVQIVMSKDLAMKIIKEQGLEKRSEFDPVMDGVGFPKSLFVAMGLAKDPKTIPLEERVIETYYRRLLVFPQGKSRVISIEFQSEDPVLAAKVANRIAEEYLRTEEGAKNQTSKVTSGWLDKAIEPLMKKVIEAEAKVEAFRSSKGLFVGTNNMNITGQQLSEMNTQLSTARSQQADLQSRAKLIREAVRLGRVFETSEINNNELVRRLLEQRASLKAQIAFDQRTLLPGHPRMKELGSQLIDLETQVRAAAERAARAFENDSRAAGARVQSLQAEMDLQKKSAGSANESEVQLKALERDAAALREQLNSYRNKFLDAAARSGENAQTADARIISRAFPQSEPIFPKKIPMILLATLGTFVVCCALIASSHLMAQQSSGDYAEAGYGYAYPAPQPPTWAGAGAMREPPPVPPQWTPPSAPEKSRFGWPFSRNANPVGAHERAPSLSPFAAPAAATSGAPPSLPPSWPQTSSSFQAPIPPTASASVENPQKRPGFAAADELARELSLMGYIGRGKIVLLQGLETDVRTSVNAVRFGRRLARDGSTIVLDLMGQQELYTRLLGQGILGLGAFLDGVASFGDVIHRDPRSRVHVIPAGTDIHGKLFGIGMRERMIGLVEALSQTYANVVIDAGTVGSSAEMLADYADAIVLITIEDEETPYLRQTAERLEALRGSPVFISQDTPSFDKGPANDPDRQSGFRSA